jgi:hypothetical protein
MELFFKEISGETFPFCRIPGIFLVSFFSFHNPNREQRRQGDQMRKNKPTKAYKFICKINTYLFPVKKVAKYLNTRVVFKKLSGEKIRPNCENSPDLVTLMSGAPSRRPSLEERLEDEAGKERVFAMRDNI